MDTKTKAIAAILGGTSKKKVKKILEQVNELILGSKIPSITEQIKIHKVKGADEDDGTCCQGQACPFFKWESLSSPYPLDGVCKLPVGHDEVIFMNHTFHDDVNQLHIKGEKAGYHRRVSKCLFLLPAGKEEKTNLKPGQFRGMHG